MTSKLFITSYTGRPEWPESGEFQWNEIVNDDMVTRVLLQPLPGDPERLHWGEQSNWVIIEASSENVIEQSGGTRVRCGRVLFNGSPREAAAFMAEQNFPVPHSLTPCIVGKDWQDIEVGENGIAIAGMDSKATSGDHGLGYSACGHVSVGEHGAAIAQWGSAEAGDFGCAWMRDRGSAKAGIRGLASTYEMGKSEAGAVGVAVTDDFGSAKAGNYGVAISGQAGQSEAGKSAIAFARSDGKVKASENSILVLRHRDDELKVARVGHDGIQPDTWYKLDENGEFVPAPDDS